MPPPPPPPPPQPSGPPGPYGPPCTPEMEAQDLNMQIYIITATIILQIFASLYLCKLTSSARPLNASRAMAAAKMCNSVSFILMCAICYFLWNTVYSCYDSPMYAIILVGSKSFFPSHKLETATCRHALTFHSLFLFLCIDTLKQADVGRFYLGW